MAASVPSSAPLCAREVRLDYGTRTVVQSATLELEPGTVTALVGPNGCGKSTLLRALARLLKPAAGAVVLDGREIHSMPTREVAKRLAILPQQRDTPSGITVRDLVAHGRHPHLGLLKRAGPDDEEAIERALHLTGLEHLAHRSVDTLSGGERQRAWIAMALAQETEVLLLDEPTTFLDIRYQVEILALVRRLNREHGLTVLWVLHDLNHAAEHSDRIVMMREGDILADGLPQDVLTRATVRNVFDIDVLVQEHPLTGAPYCIPLAPGTGPASPSEATVPIPQGA